MTAPEPSVAPDQPRRRRTRVFLVGYYGFDNLGDYMARNPHFGAMTGRFANRIAVDLPGHGRRAHERARAPDGRARTEVRVLGVLRVLRELRGCVWR